MELGLWMLVVGKLELGLVVEEGCFDLASANAIVGLPAPDVPACLTLGQLGDRWGVVLAKDDVNSVIEVTSGGERLPSVRALLRETTWRKLGHRQDPTAVEEVAAVVEARPEITLRGAVDTQRNRGTQELGLRTALGPGTLDLRLRDTTDDGLERVRTHWSAVGPHHRLRLGDTSIQANHLTNHYEGRGVTARYGATGRRANAYMMELEGDRPGADFAVEAYVNGVLVDYLPAGDERWAFDLPQPAEIEIKFWHPDGTEVVERYGTRARSLLAPGRVSADLSMIEVERNVLGKDADAVDGPDVGDVALRAEGAVGVLPGLNLTASHRRLPRGQRLTGVGARTAPGSLEIVQDATGAIASLAEARLGGLHLEGEVRQEGFDAARRRGLERRIEGEYRHHGTRGTVSPGVTYETYHSGREILRLDLDTRLRLDDYTLSLDSTITHNDAAGWGSPSLRPAVRWRGGLTEVIASAHVSADDLYGSTLSGALRHRLTGTESASVSGSWNRDGWRAAPSISSAEIDGWRASLSTPFDSEGNIGMMLSFSTTIGFDADWEPRTDAKGGKAFVAVGVFLDIDGDGHWDVDEAGIEGVPVRGVGTTDRDGFAKAWMRPGRELIIDLGVDELDDPRHYGTGARAATVRPGAFNRINYPVRFVDLGRS